MYIDYVQIFNYCSLKNNYIALRRDDPNIFIGINDCGKTTTLKAIDLLLSEKPKFNFLSDVHVKSDVSNSRIDADAFNQFFTERDLPLLDYNGHQTVIIAKFIVEPEEITDEIQADVSNHLLWSIEHFDNYFIFARVFDERTNSFKDFLVTRDKSTEPNSLFNEKQAAINRERNELTITNEEINNDNNRGRFRNLEIIRAIYNRYETRLYWFEYNSKKDRFLFPTYRYIDWNITLDDLNEFTNEILNNSIVTFLSATKDFANTQANLAQTNVNTELERFTIGFATDLPSIQRLKANVKFDVKSTITDILINKLNSDGDIHLDTQGEGIKKQIWFSLIKWKSLRDLTNNPIKKFIWCFDEPENHLYPRAQREFFEIIKNVYRSNVQSLISTHSTIFIDRAKFDIIKKVDLSDGYSVLSGCSTVTDIYDSLSLKNSDFLFFDKFLVYEGDTEEVIFPYLYKLQFNKSFIDDGIQIINLGGKDNIAQNKTILKQILEDFNKTEDRVVFILDKDASYELTRTELENNNFHFVGKQDIEDSISSEVWLNLISAKFNGYCEVSLDEINNIKDNIPEGRGVQSNQKFYPKLKSLLRTKIANPDDLHLVEDNLPSKGKNSGETLKNYILTINQVDANVLQAFNMLRNGN